MPNSSPLYCIFTHYSLVSFFNYTLNLYIFFFSTTLKVCHTLHRTGRPYLPPQLPAQHGLRDVREPRPHLRHRLHQGPDEQLSGPCARAGSSTEHQHHLTEPADGEHQDQSCGARDSWGCVSGPRRTQESAAGHGTLPEIRCWEDSISGEGN